MVIRDYDANAYARNYWWWFAKRFNPKHPSYFFNKLRTNGLKKPPTSKLSLKLDRIQKNASADL
jgi:hypothetical protein